MTENDTQLPVPGYIRDLYPHYLSSTTAYFSSGNWYAWLTTFGFYKKLTNAVLNLIRATDSVMQTGVVLGGFEDIFASLLEEKGKFSVCDVSPVQLRLCREHLAAYPKVAYVSHDVTLPFEKKYDKIVSWFLLHEIPDASKREAIKNILKALKKEGAAVFVDYHAPARRNVLRFLLKPYNRLEEPFAESLWDADIRKFCDTPSRYSWKKTLFCGGLYQVVVVKTKKERGV